MSMTDDQLNAIEARFNNEKLPPAPWRWHYYSQYRDDDRGTLHASCTPSIIAGDVDEVTGQFLAKARQDIPALVAEVRRLRGQVDAVSEAFANWESVRTVRNDINSHEWLALVAAMTGLEQCLTSTSHRLPRLNGAESEGA